MKDITDQELSLEHINRLIEEVEAKDRWTVKAYLNAARRHAGKNPEVARRCVENALEEDNNYAGILAKPDDQFRLWLVNSIMRLNQECLNDIDLTAPVPQALDGKGLSWVEIVRLATAYPDVDTLAFPIPEPGMTSELRDMVFDLRKAGYPFIPTEVVRLQDGPFVEQLAYDFIEGERHQEIRLVDDDSVPRGHVHAKSGDRVVVVVDLNKWAAA